MTLAVSASMLWVVAAQAQAIDPDFANILQGLKRGEPAAVTNVVGGSILKLMPGETVSFERMTADILADRLKGCVVDHSDAPSPGEDGWISFVCPDRAPEFSNPRCYVDGVAILVRHRQGRVGLIVSNGARLKRDGGSECIIPPPAPPPIPKASSKD